MGEDPPRACGAVALYCASQHSRVPPGGSRPEVTIAGVGPGRAPALDWGGFSVRDLPPDTVPAT